MAKLICICPRDPNATLRLESAIDRLNERLTPDNITPPAPATANETGVTTVLLNPTASIPRHGASVCLGILIDPGTDWWRPGAPVPDGTYALVRCGDDSIEIINDPVGSRTVWYAKTDELFLASTSQRAIVAFLGSFEPNPAAYPWMLSSGQLGPDNSWDRRISVMRSSSRIVLDRRSWRLDTHQTSNEIEPVRRARKDHAEGLGEAITHTFDALDIDTARWVLPLSGGVDSRAILMWLKNRDGLRCVTWGLRTALEDKGNDAYIASQLAAHLGLNHRFFETDMSNEPIDTLFDRYFVAGEGRVDAVAGYMDGFKIWKDIFESGADGVIRGDECFGMRMPAYTDFGVRRYVNCLLLSDYANLPPGVVDDLPQQELPAHLLKREGEPLLRWRDRLYYNFRMPYVMAALNDLKCSYVELINPFLSRGIVDYVRTIPDSLRLGRKPFMDVATRMGPDIPYAVRSAIDTPTNIFRSPELVKLMKREIGATEGGGLLPSSLLGFLENNTQIQKSGGPSRPETHPKYLLPTRIRETLGAITRRPRGLYRDRFKKPTLDANVLAFRAFIICRMHRMMNEDAGSLEL